MQYHTHVMSESSLATVKCHNHLWNIPQSSSITVCRHTFNYWQWVTSGEYFYILKTGLCHRSVEPHSHTCSAEQTARMSLASEER